MEGISIPASLKGPAANSLSLLGMAQGAVLAERLPSKKL